ncbi:MAG: hypothetical protein FWC61_04105 [Proteobacteria bacterium]|nr:hypothetical protein [Pseudomonadota bacterium]
MNKNLGRIFLIGALAGFVATGAQIGFNHGGVKGAAGGGVFNLILGCLILSPAIVRMKRNVKSR